MGISSTANKHGFRVAGRVAGEEDDIDLASFKAEHKTMQKAFAALYWVVETQGYSDSSNQLIAKVITVLKDSGFSVHSYGAKRDLEGPVYAGMKISRELGANASVVVWKIPGYTDGKTMIVAHGNAYPATKLEEDYKSNGPITRALAAYHNATKRH